jgi:hypothetical protein
MLPSASELCKVAKAVQEVENKKREERMQELMAAALVMLESRIVERAEAGYTSCGWGEDPPEELVDLTYHVKKYSANGFWFCGGSDRFSGRLGLTIGWETKDESASDVRDDGEAKGLWKLPVLRWVAILARRCGRALRLSTS